MILAVQIAWVLVSIIAVLVVRLHSVTVDLSLAKRRGENLESLVNRYNLWLHKCVFKPIVKKDEFIIHIPTTNRVYPQTNLNSIVMSKHNVKIVQVLNHHEWIGNDRAFVVESLTDPNMGYFTVWESELRPKE